MSGNPWLLISRGALPAPWPPVREGRRKPTRTCHRRSVVKSRGKWPTGSRRVRCKRSSSEREPGRSWSAVTERKSVLGSRSTAARKSAFRVVGNSPAQKASTSDRSGTQKNSVRTPFNHTHTNKPKD